jgi:nucleolar protein 9
VDEEDKQLLVANVMEEIAGKEQKAAADPACSRHIEALLSIAQPAQLIAFLRSIMDTGGMFELAVRWVDV